jgi:hypothetical protein
LADFFVRRWLPKARRRTSLPVAVTLMRFFVPLCVLFLAIGVPFTNMQTIFDPWRTAGARAISGLRQPERRINPVWVPAS